MSLYTLGLNHRTAPLDVRETIAFQPDAMGQALRDLLGQPKVKEAAILSTCNRTEVYWSGTASGTDLMHWLTQSRASEHDLSSSIVKKYGLYLRPSLYQHIGPLSRAEALDPARLETHLALGNLLLAAEYIVNEGNANVVLCERGVRSFEESTRNMLDLAAKQVAKVSLRSPRVVNLRNRRHGAVLRR